MNRPHLLVNASALAGASLWRILLSFILFWYIARTLGVDALGQYALGMAYLNVAAILSECGLPNLLVRDLAQHSEWRSARMKHALGIQLGSSLLIWGALVVIVPRLPLSAGVQQSILVGAAFLPFYALTSVGLTLCKAAERMDLVFWTETTGATILLAGSMVLIWRGDGVVSLFSVQVVAQTVVAALVLLLVKRSRLICAPQTALSFDGLRLLRRALPFFGLSLAEVLLQRLDVLMLGMLASDAVVGIYAAANNLVRVATKLVQSVWWALYPTLSRLRLAAPDRYRLLLRRTLDLGSLLMVPAAAFSVVVAPGVMHLVYGADYNRATLVFQILVCGLPFFFLETYAITTLMVERRPQLSLWIIGTHLALLATTLPPLTNLAGAEGAAGAALLGSCAGAGVSILFMIPSGLPAYPARLLRLILATGCATLGMVLVPIGWLGQLAVGSILFGIAVWLLGLVDPGVRESLRRRTFA